MHFSFWFLFAMRQIGALHHLLVTEHQLSQVILLRLYEPDSTVGHQVNDNMRSAISRHSRSADNRSHPHSHKCDYLSSLTCASSVTPAVVLQLTELPAPVRSIQ